MDQSDETEPVTAPATALVSETELAWVENPAGR